MNLDEIWLEAEQERVLIALVEASRRQPREKRERFARVTSFEMDEINGLADYGQTYLGNIQALIEAGLLRDSSSSFGTLLFDVSQLGYRYYEYMMKLSGEPTERIEDNIQRYLEAGSFEKRHSTAYTKWKQAEGLLWGSDSQQQHTAVGHHCREAMQFFATSLVEKYQPSDVEQDIAKDDQTLGGGVEASRGADEQSRCGNS